jgi:non-ribosomal peptide synthetase component F
MKVQMSDHIAIQSVEHDEFFDRAVSIHECLESQAARTPARPAITSGGTTLTYRQLNTRANQLARHLIQHGIRPEDRVALLLDRSVSVVVSALAVLKCGAVFVPLDSRSPVARLRVVAGEVKPSAVLVDGSFGVGGFGWSDGGPVVVDVRELADREGEVPAPGVPGHPDQLAYVMYTSGSTGAPKGTAVTHRNVLQLAAQSCWRSGSVRRVLFHSWSTSCPCSTAVRW